MFARRTLSEVEIMVYASYAHTDPARRFDSVMVTRCVTLAFEQSVSPSMNRMHVVT